MLRATTRHISDLNADDRQQMFQLMASHYDEIDRARFDEDLSEKHRVVLLQDETQALQGFSTYLVYATLHPTTRQPVRVIYSGDTIINRAHWGSQALAFEWLYQAGREKAREPEAPLYWFLISKGIRTYRYLAAFSRTYWPHPVDATPDEARALLEAVATQRFGAHYQPALGVIKFDTSRGHLRQELAIVDVSERRRPEVEFFLQANPGYAQGDELACLTELSSDNLKPLARRVFNRGLAEAPCDDSDERLESTA